MARISSKRVPGQMGGGEGQLDSDAHVGYHLAIISTTYRLDS